MSRMKNFKAINLMVAFAIFWVSFASIIQFHISKIHGEDLTSTVVFVKTADKHYKVKDPITFKPSDLNAGILIENDIESNSLYNHLQKNLILLKSKCISHFCVKLHSLRGPPSL